MKTSKRNYRFLMFIFLFTAFVACSSDDSSDDEPLEDTVSLVSLTPESPDTLNCGTNVEFTFNYTTSESDGVRIFGRPFTNGNLTPDYAAHASPLHPSGEGTETGFFLINSAQEVDQIRIQMWDADQNNLLFETFIDVDYTFVEHSVTLASIAPESPSTLNNGDPVQLTFNYKTTESGGVRIFPRPITNGSLTPSYAASGSPIYTVGEGNGSGQFTITSGAVNVDQIRFLMTNANQSATLLEIFIDVDYTFE